MIVVMSRNSRRPFHIATCAGLFILYSVRGGLAFYVASAFSLDDLFKYLPANPKPVKVGIPAVPLKTLRAI